jgi:4-hydroxy-3-methylbut-2-enyl diphosphate reductase
VEAIEVRRSSSRDHEITRSREDHPAPFEYHDTICRNVANRVKELQDFARSNDIVFFVGGTKSSNARVLYNICIEANPNTFFISSPDEVEEVFQSEGRSFSETVFQRSGLSGAADLKVGICGATSTPLWLMEKVRDKLADLHHS